MTSGMMRGMGRGLCCFLIAILSTGCFATTHKELGAVKALPATMPSNLAGEYRDQDESGRNGSLFAAVAGIDPAALPGKPAKRTVRLLVAGDRLTAVLLVDGIESRRAISEYSYDAGYYHDSGTRVHSEHVILNILVLWNVHLGLRADGALAMVVKSQAWSLTPLPGFTGGDPAQPYAIFFRRVDAAAKPPTTQEQAP